MPENLGEQFLHKRDSTLHTSQPVEHEVERRLLRGEAVSQKPADKITNWLEVVKRTHTGHRDDERVLERIKEYYHREHVIEESNIPESHFKNQQRIAREQGHGDIVITPEMRHQLSEVIITDQQSTLDNWVDYLTSADTDHHPTWAKYWAFNGMLQLSTFDKQKHAFAKRGKDTVAPFPDLNREALAYVMDTMEKKVKRENIPADDNPELHSLLQSANFGKLYVYAMEKVTPTEENELLRTDGEWVVYSQYSDHMPLVQSLQGHGTGWCTAGESTAQAQLQTGDFHVYYSYDKDGKPTIPRVAIRMDGNGIAEVRGIAHEQNLDPYIGDVVQRKLEQFADGQKYQKKNKDMSRLTGIERKILGNEELTPEELRFIYEIDQKIEGFGYEEDPRIAQIVRGRNIVSDLANITGFDPSDITTDHWQLRNRTYKCFYGSFSIHTDRELHQYNLPECFLGHLYIHVKRARNLVLPTIVHSLEMRNLQEATSVRFPSIIRETLDISALRSAEGVVLPESVGNLKLDGITSAEGLILPGEIRELSIDKLKSVDNLRFPTEMDTLSLDSVTDVENVALPKRVGTLSLNGLRKARGLALPEGLHNLFLDSLATHEGLELPKKMDNLTLRKLKNAKGLVLPEEISGLLALDRLESAEGLVLPKKLASIDLRSLKSAKGLQLPETVNGKLVLSGLLSDEDLQLPRQVRGFLDLSGLQEINGLNFPEVIDGRLVLTKLRMARNIHFPNIDSLELDALEEAEDVFFPEIYNGDISLGVTDSARGIHFPLTINGSLYLMNLRTGQNTVFPERVVGDLDLRSITTAKGLNLPDIIGGELDLGGLTDIKDLVIPKEVGSVIFRDISNAAYYELLDRYPNLKMRKAPNNNEGRRLTP